MQAELETKTLELMTWLEQVIKTTADFTAEQVPLFIQELLTYNFYMSLGWFVMGLLIIITTIISTYKFIKWMNRTHNWDAFPVLTLSFISIIVGIVMSADHLDWIKIKLAPRVYLMEYVKDNLK
jgi:uncharacterized membrane protein SpoIIM required for sporulation